MDYYCEICDKHIFSKSRSLHHKSKLHKEISKKDQVKISLEDLNFDEKDEIYNLYLLDHDKKFDFDKEKVIFKLVFDSINFFKYITCCFKNKTTRFWFKQISENVIGDFRNEGHEFDYIEEMDIISAVGKRDRTYQFYMKHNMCSSE